MQRASFERRPVAARAADVRVFGTVPPGERLELEISVQSCKSVAIAYEGEGRIGGKPVVELRGAAGAMLPMSEFDSPDAARARFEALLTTGLAARRFPERAAFAPAVPKSLDLVLDDGGRVHDPHPPPARPGPAAPSVSAR